MAVIRENCGSLAGQFCNIAISAYFLCEGYSQHHCVDNQIINPEMQIYYEK